LLVDLGYTVETTIFEDNTAAISLIQTRGQSNTRKAKHIECKAWWLHSYISNGDIDLIWLPTERMLADTFTKLLDNKRKVLQISMIISGRAGIKISHKDDYVLSLDNQQKKIESKRNVGTVDEDN
jgi:hypothetical protein